MCPWCFGVGISTPESGGSGRDVRRRGHRRFGSGPSRPRIGEHRRRHRAVDHRRRRIPCCAGRTVLGSCLGNLSPLASLAPGGAVPRESGLKKTEKRATAIHQDSETPSQGVGEWGDAAGRCRFGLVDGRCSPTTLPHPIDLRKPLPGVPARRSSACRLPSSVFRLSAVPEAGLEPARSCPQWILSPSRLPIPPLRQAGECSWFPAKSVRTHVRRYHRAMGSRIEAKLFKVNQRIIELREQEITHLGRTRHVAVTRRRLPARRGGDR